MKGYKALDENMCAVNGDGMQYELGKEYVQNNIPKIGARGYHFCKELIYVYKYYLSNSRVFEIDTLNGNIGNYDKIIYCSNKIKLTREVSKEEIDKYFKDNLDKFINDKDECVRAAVARQGYSLNTLINDEDEGVRIAVAYQKYGLDVLINDEDECVRAEVARQGYGLDILINDSAVSVRAEVAKQKYGLDKLINDPDLFVREAANDILLKEDIQYERL